MPRSVLSLLAVLVLLLASQAAADGRGGGRHDGPEGDEDDGRGRDRDGHGEDGGRDGSDGEEGEDDGEDGDEGRRDKDPKEERRERNEGRDPRPSPREAKPQTNGAPAIQRALRSDAGLAVLPTALPGRAQFSFVVSSVAAADGLALRATMPDTGSPWTLSGPSAAPCRLDGRALECAFEGLAPGDVRLVQATSAVARAPPWELVASGSVTTAGDATPGNDRARAGLGLLLPWTGAEPAGARASPS